MKLAPIFALLLATVAHAEHPVQTLLNEPNAHLISSSIGEIAEPLRINTHHKTLAGINDLIATNPAQPAIVIEGAKNIRLRDLFIRRNNTPASSPAILLINCTDVVIEDVSISENQAKDGAIEIRDSSNITVRGCTITNYKRIAIDDRTGSDLYGYAFHCIDGHGITVKDSQQVWLHDNRIIEETWLPTQENAEQHSLGRLTEGSAPTRVGTLAGAQPRDGYVNNWHQGSAIVVTGPEKSRNIHIRGNYLRNCAQGIDIHADNVHVRDNTIDHGMIGIKATHGAQNLNIANNLLTHVDLWGILLNPGAASHGPLNADGNTVISGNIISDFGFGHEYWNWGGRHEDAGSSYGIALLEGQLPENPPLRNVLVTGNVMQITNAEETPRHRFALYIAPPRDAADEPAPKSPENIEVSANSFAAGRGGITN